MDKRINRSTAVVLLDQALYSGSNFLLTFLLARALNIFEFGMYSYVLLMIYFLLSIINAVIIQPYQIIVSKKPKQEAMGFVLKLWTLFYLTILGFACFVYFFSESLVLPFLEEKTIIFYKNYKWGILLFVSGYIIQDFFRKSLLAIQKITLVVFIDLLFLVVFLYLCLTEITLGKTFFSLGIFNIISAIPGLLYFILKSNFKTADKDYLKYHIQHGKWLLSTSVLQWFSNNFLVFISGIYLGLEALGALRLVQSFFGVLNIILQTVENFFLPKTAKLFNRSRSDAAKYLSELTQKGAFIFGPFLLVVFVFSEQIIILLGGEKYQGYGYVIKLMALLYVFIVYGYPVRIAVRILELNKIFFFGYVISFVFSLISFHFLLKYTALYGVLAGLIVSQILMIFYWKSKIKKNNFAR